MASCAASGAPPASTTHRASGAATTDTTTRLASSLMRTAGRSPATASDFHDLGLFGLDHLVDLRDVVVVDLLEVLLGVLHVVLAHAAHLLEGVAGVRARVPHGDLAVLGQLVHDLHELLAPLLVHLRERNADRAPLGGGLETEIRLADRLLDRLHLPLVER